MGFRQPTATGAFFAQAKAGTKKQAEAREKLQKPQAIGGSAGAGTAMVAAGTQAQEAATQQVQETGQKAGTELKVKDQNLGTSTVSTIAGTPAATPTTTPAATTATAQQFTGGISGPAAINPKIKETQDKITSISNEITKAQNMPIRGTSDLIRQADTLSRLFKDLDTNKSQLAQLNIESPAPSVEGIGESGDVAAVENMGTKINQAIDDITKQKNDLNNRLLSANAEDAKKIQAELDRLNGILKVYQDKLTTENLGQVAGPSAFEQQMLEREQLLAGEGGDVGKIAALFGRKRGDIRTSKYGALESQIYGKDLEAIQEAAKAGLTEKAAAERGSDVAMETYAKTLEEGKKGYEATIKSAQDKLEILKKTPQELAGYTRDELKKMFDNNEALVNELFRFDKDGKVIGTKVSETRSAYEDRLTKLGTEKEKIGGELSIAKTTASNQLKNELLPTDRYGNPIQSDVTIAQKLVNPASTGLGKVDDRFRSVADKYKNSVANIENKLRNAIDRGDKKEAYAARDLLKELINKIREEYKIIRQEFRR